MAKSKASQKAAIAAQTPLPEVIEIVIHEMGEDKNINYTYQEQALKKASFNINKKYSELTDEQKIIYDSFVEMIDSLE